MFDEVPMFVWTLLWLASGLLAARLLWAAGGFPSTCVFVAIFGPIFWLMFFAFVVFDAARKMFWFLVIYKNGPKK